MSHDTLLGLRVSLNENGNPMKAIYIKLIASLFARMREKCFHSRLTSHHQAAAHRRRKSEEWQKIEFHNLILIVLCSLRKNRFNEIELFASENQFHFSPSFISEKLNFKLLNSEHVSQLSYRPALPRDLMSK